MNVFLGLIVLAQVVGLGFLFAGANLNYTKGNFTVLLLVIAAYWFAGLLITSLLKDYLEKIATPMLWVFCVLLSVFYLLPPVLFSLVMSFFLLTEK